MFDSLTREEVLLGVYEVVGGLVHLNLTLPRLRHVPHSGVAGYHMELKKKKKRSQRETRFHFQEHRRRKRSFRCILLPLTANISASRRVLYSMLLVVSTWSS